MSLVRSLKVAFFECGLLFNVVPFEHALERQFLINQAKVRAMLMGLAGVTTFVAFSIYAFIFLVRETAFESDLAARIIATATSIYFLFVAYWTLLKKGDTKSTDLVSLSVPFVFAFTLVFTDLFRSADQARYDLLPTLIVILAMSGISRFSHKLGRFWIVTIVLSYALGKWFLFGSFGPDSFLIASDRGIIRSQFSIIDFVQFLQAATISYLIFRANEARERQIFLREYQLEKAAAERLQMLQGIGHDLRQPMTALMLHSDFARQRAASSDYKQMSESLTIIEDNLHIMNSELTQVTELAAAADPSANFALKPILIVGTLNSLVDAFLPRAASSEIHLKLSMPNPLKTLNVFSEDLLIRRCLSNLISNAFKFTEIKPDGTIKEITIGGDLSNSFLDLFVFDTGIGIAPENLEKIWEPFFQIGNPARNSEMGFGLGLAHVRAAIDRMPGHSISVSSKLGEGTKFTIRVPLSNQIEEAEMPLTKASKENAGRTSNDWAFEGSLILLVEDDALLRSSLSRGFESWGARVAEADCVESAKKLIDSLEVPPDFAIVDFRLPDGDARDVFKHIETSRAHTEGCTCHWICLTGEHSTNLKKLEGTQISVIRKPVNLAGLRTRLIEIAGTTGV
jgi:signal transduction histidine kinase/CheY-like chemotaxis protein